MGAVKVKRIENSWFSSNTYIFYTENNQNAWLVDCGDFEEVEEWLFLNKKKICGIFITHCHFDHIYGINKALNLYPDLKIYASRLAFDGMGDSKINGSKYTENAFATYGGSNIILNDGDIIILDEFIKLEVIETLGHSLDSCCYIVGNLLFTGDAFIPNIRTVSKLRGGNREKAKETVLFLYEKYNSNGMLVCPGHMEICNMGDIYINKMI